MHQNTVILYLCVPIQELQNKEMTKTDFLTHYYISCQIINIHYLINWLPG